MPKVYIRPPIPEPTEEIGSLLATVKALKEAVEILQGQRAGMEMAAVRWQDLVDHSLVGAGEVPKR